MKNVKKKYIIAGISAAVLCVIAVVLIRSLLFQDIRLTNDTIPLGSGADSETRVEKQLLDLVESEYTCKVSDTDIDVNEQGTYFVEYVYLKNGKEYTKRFDIHVTDQTGPEITFLNQNSDGTVYAFLDDEASFIENIALTDNCDGEIKPSAENVKIENVIFSVKGENDATVICSDSAGNTTEEHVTVQVIDPEIALYDYLENYAKCEGVRFCGTSGEISFRQDNDELFDGDSFYLTDMKYVTSKLYTSGDDGATFHRRFSFDENFVITEVSSDHTLRSSTMTSARIAVQHEDAWNSAAYQNLVGTTLSYPAFSGLEEDPIIKELGGLKYFCGKDEAALSGVKVSLKDKSVISG